MTHTDPPRSSFEQRRQALYRERPPNWDALLFILVLREGLQRIAADWEKAVHATRSPTLHLSTEQDSLSYLRRCAAQLQEWPDRVERFVAEQAERCSDSTESTPEAVEAQAHRLLEQIEELVHWEQALAAVLPHPSCAPILKSLRGKTGPWLTELRKLPEWIDAAPGESSGQPLLPELKWPREIDPSLIPNEAASEEQLSRERAELWVEAMSKPSSPPLKLDFLEVLLIYLVPGWGFFYTNRPLAAVAWLFWTILLYGLIVPGLVLHLIYIVKIQKILREVEK